jgi:hypothetical protein
MGNLNSVTRFWSFETPQLPANQDKDEDEDEVMVTQVLSQPLQPPEEDDDDEVKVTQFMLQPTDSSTSEEDDGDEDNEEEDDNDNEAVEMAEATLVVQPKAEVEGELKAEVLAEAVPVSNQLNNTVLRIVRVTDRVRLSVSSTIFFFYLLLALIYTFHFSKIQANVAFLCPPLHPDTRVGYCIRRFCLIYCDNIQLRLSARMLCWLIYNGRTPTNYM